MTSAQACAQLPAALEQLRRRYDRPCLPLEEVRAEWFPHITSTEHLLRQIRAGRIRLRYTRLHSRHAPAVVYLDDLARYLCSRHPGNNSTTQPVAHQAAKQPVKDTAP